MTLSDLLRDLMPKKKECDCPRHWDDCFCGFDAYNQALSDISSIEIPEDRLREMGYVKKEVLTALLKEGYDN